MTEEEKQKKALEIAQDVLENIEFSYIYEDEDLENATDDDLTDIHEIIMDRIAVHLV